MQPMQLALEWYRHTPLPDAAPAAQAPRGRTQLSQRLLSAFDAGLYPDLYLRAVAGTPEASSPPAAEVAAHRVVLRRNPALLRAGLLSGAAEDILRGVRAETLRAALRAHYVEELEDGKSTAPAGNAGGVVAPSGPVAELWALRKRTPEAEWLLLEKAFGGPLDASTWTSLSSAVATESFTDVALCLAGGVQIPVHRAVVAGVEDGHFFSAALRWPGVGGDCGNVDANESPKSLALPEGLSQEAFRMLLRLRYGGQEVLAEYILEARHFAELLDWPDARRCCEDKLEAMLADARNMDEASLMAVFSHAEESVGMPPHLRAAALTAGVRQWFRVAEAAGAALPAKRCTELAALHRIRSREGHVCGSLEEYLHAFADDLFEMERSLALDAPQAARLQVERGWRHWRELLFEYGQLNGASTAERWHTRVREQREDMRSEREQAKTESMRLPKGRVWFEASPEWREVPANAICPGGLEYRFDMQTGKNFARLMV
eukprot:TRINITY_DN47501_c0_g1_i1.p1 TRINITY_DN47501_c0_g1~~TRINITY_DN47501_c0_g1_i1.p1  ORF type:complete len:490 (+),score=106.07 TRINITY_DN47501_c0_g1_i1:84-1553(+)